MNWKKDGANARHPVNAMLNYGYAVLISQIAIELAAAGFDLSIGIAHSGRRNPKALVYDFMEPLRPVVDRQVLQFALAQTFTPGDFTINNWGGCRLNPQMARAVVREMPPLKDTVQLVHQFLGQLHIRERPTKTLIPC